MPTHLPTHFLCVSNAKFNVDHDSGVKHYLILFLLSQKGEMGTNTSPFVFFTVFSELNKLHCFKNYIQNKTS